MSVGRDNIGAGDVWQARPRPASGRRFVAALLCAAAAAAAAGGCGGGGPPEVLLDVMGWWNDNPSTVDQTGYQVAVDIGWPARHDACFPLSPNLHIRANDGEAIPMVDGDCQWDVLVFIGPFRNNDPVTIRLEDGDRVLGEAQIGNLFPGADSHLLVPSAGTQVKVGDPITLSVPAPVGILDSVASDFYWLDMPANAPPFHTFVPGTMSADGTTLETAAPTLTGHAAVVGKNVFTDEHLTVTSCTGFSICTGLPETGAIGPVFVEVVP